MSPKVARYLVAVLCGTAPLEVIAQAATTGVEVAASYTVTSDIVYHRASGQQLTLDLYVPQASDTPVPVLIYYHGGGWVVGDRHSSSLQILPYLERGFAVVNVSYRLAEAALAPAAVVDAVCALRWVVRSAAERGLDPNRIVVSGHSAGGHLALIVGMLPEDTPFANECAAFSELLENTLGPARAAAVVNWFGITDVADLLVEPNRQLYAEQWIGGQLDGVEIARRVSPIQYVRRDLPPIITIHGDADPYVPYEQAVRLQDALHSIGSASELVTVPDGGHGGFSLAQDASSYSRIWSFLRNHGVSR